MLGISTEMGANLSTREGMPRDCLRGAQGGNDLWVLIQPTFPNLITIEDKFYLCLSQWEPNHWIPVKGWV